MAPRVRQLAWFVGIWAGSICVLGAISLTIRWWLKAG